MSNDKGLVSFDYAIKYLIKDKGDYEIVEGFISALFASEGYKPIKIKALLGSESNKESKHLKRSIADVIVEDEEGNNYIVEIDRAYTNLFLHKAVFNTSRLIIDNIGANQDYLKIKKVFHINLLYFAFEDTKSPYMKKVAERLNILKMTNKEREVYDTYIMDSMKGRDYLISAEEKGKAEGISIGEARGIEKGIEKGETKKAVEIAKAMLTKNKPMEEIVEFTGLTVKEIEKLK